MQKSRIELIYAAFLLYQLVGISNGMSKHDDHIGKSARSHSNRE